MRRSLRSYVLSWVCGAVTATLGGTPVDVGGDPGRTVGNDLRNAGFEQIDAGGGFRFWESYGQGYTPDRTVVHGGRAALRCDCSSDHAATGAKQIIRYARPDRRPVFVSGWSRARDVVGNGDYSIYLDIIYADGTPWWAQTCPFTPGTHGWEYQSRIFYPARPVREIRVYILLRRTTGSAWFDDIEICRGGLHIAQARAAWDYPRTRAGVRVRAGMTASAAWRCIFRGRTGRTIHALSGSGKRIEAFWPNPAGRFPVSVTIEARDRTGQSAVIDLPLPKHPRRPNSIPHGAAVWTRTGMKKVYPDEFPAAPTRAAEVELHLAQNEHEGFQIALSMADDSEWKNVTLIPGVFRSDDGRVLPKSALRWYVVGYVWVDTPAPHPWARRAPGWRPEVLLPAQPFDVRPGTTQTVWVDVFAPTGTAPGVYRGELILRSAEGETVTTRTTIEVWPFSLPRTPRMKTAFSIMDGFTREVYGNISPALRKRCLDIMLDHRLNPDDISRTEPPRLEDLLYARTRGLNAFNVLNLVPKPRGNPLWVCYAPLQSYGPSFLEELRARLDPVAAALRKHDLIRLAYVYGFDERGPEYDPVIREICRFIKSRYPGLHTFTTAGYLYKRQKEAGGTAPDDFMDWYCPLTPRYDPEVSERLRLRGKQVWWYVCCGPRYPHANFAAIDYPSIEGRLLGWMTYGFRVDGLLFWHVNYWHGNAIVRGESTYLDWKPLCVAGMTGDGCLIYPGPDGPMPSIRLENIRDGIEDYDYFCLVEKACGRAAAMHFYRKMVADRTSFSRDPERLNRIRDQMATAILQSRER